MRSKLLVFCASNRASYLTGIHIFCDGGVVASMTLRNRIAVARNPQRIASSTGHGASKDIGFLPR